jgi:two-component system, chemotaxis family, protein-glutamate methylesterase/glutaminase
MSTAPRIRVLIVDDSAIVRRVLSDTLAAETDIEVVGTAPDPFVARDKILALRPDVLTLDIEMPRMDGLTFLSKLMQHWPLPVIIISSLGHSATALEALRRGAVEVLCKPGGPYSVSDLKHDLPQKIRSAAASHCTPMATPPPQPAAAPAPSPARQTTPRIIPPATYSGHYQLIAVGASTGGVTAIEDVLTALPGGLPGIVITQHIPAGFSASFANRLDTLCPFRVKEAADGDPIQPGQALIAPGNFHLSVRRATDGFRAVVQDGPRVCFQRPAVDVLFNSVAETVGNRAIGVILTGMGNDGAEGLLRMRQQGAYTMAQNEATSVVYGMPREAVERGAVCQILPLGQIAAAVVGALVSAPGHHTERRPRALD